MSTEIIYPSEKYFKSFHEALSIVAKERVYRGVLGRVSVIVGGAGPSIPCLSR